MAWGRENQGGSGFGIDPQVLMPRRVLGFRTGEGYAGRQASKSHQRPHHGTRDRQRWRPGEQVVERGVLVEQVAQDDAPGARRWFVGVGIRWRPLDVPLLRRQTIQRSPQRLEPVALDGGLADEKPVSIERFQLVGSCADSHVAP